MLDIVGAIALSSIFVLLVGGVTVATPWSKRTKLWTAAGLLSWGALLVAVSATHVFEQASEPGVPTVAFGVAPPLIIGLLGWSLMPGLRRSLMQIPTSVLTALNIGRVLGVFFIILQYQGRLSAPFAPSAGWGDVATGLLAIPLSILLFQMNGRPSGYARAWNAFGVLDLLVAVGLGIASSPDASFRIFDAAPGTAVMGTLPWVLIPTVLVPFYLAIHLIIGAQLRRDSRSALPLGAEHLTNTAAYEARSERQGRNPPR